MNPVARLREALKMTQAEFALAIDVRQSSVSHYEQRRHSPSVSTARKMVALARSRGVEATLDSLLEAGDTPADREAA